MNGRKKKHKKNHGEKKKKKHSRRIKKPENKSQTLKQCILQQIQSIPNPQIENKSTSPQIKFVVKLELLLHSEVESRGLSHFAVGFYTLGVWLDFEFGRWNGWFMHFEGLGRFWIWAIVGSEWTDLIGWFDETMKEKERSVERERDRAWKKRRMKEIWRGIKSAGEKLG